MNRRFALLLAVTAVAVAAAWTVSERRAPRTGIESPPLFPGLLERVNDIGRIEIAADGAGTVLVRDGGLWRIENRDRYPARAEAVTRLAVQVAAIRVVEEKTSRPDLYSRLGVDDIETPGSGAVRLRLLDATGRPVAALLAGRMRAAQAGGPRTPARYVRRVGQPQALLVQGALEIPVAPVEWMDAELLDIAQDRVASVSIRHVDGSSFEIRRADPQAREFTASLPPGWTPKSAALLLPLAAVLADLRFEDVRAAAAFSFAPGSATVTTLRTFDGLTIETATAGVDGRAWTRIAARADAPAGGPAQDATQVSEQAKAIGERCDGWVFALPVHVAARLTRTLQDLALPPAAK
ncbi:MAG: DUF4340 domain-containing protein [Gammaproteobacteria bacterium]